MTLEKYNSYFCLISIETFVLRFIENLKRKINKGTLNLKPFVSAGERIKGKHLWVKFIQNDIKRIKRYSKISGFTVIGKLFYRFSYKFLSHTRVT